MTEKELKDLKATEKELKDSKASEKELKDLKATEKSGEKTESIGEEDTSPKDQVSKDKTAKDLEAKRAEQAQQAERQRKLKKALRLLKVRYFIWGVLVTSLAYLGWTYYNQQETAKSYYDLASQEFDSIKAYQVVGLTKGMAHVDVYQVAYGKVIVNVYSEFQGDTPQSFAFYVDKAINKGNVSVEWQLSDTNDPNSEPPAAHISVKVDDITYFDQTVSYLERVSQGLNQIFKRGE